MIAFANAEFAALQQPLMTLLSQEPDLPKTQRVFHGRGHCYDGLAFINIDYFNPAKLVLITLYQEPPAGLLLQMIEWLSQQPCVEHVLVQRRYLPQSPTEWVIGEPADAMEIEEEGLLYHIYPGQQQNLGFFLDMAEGRRWLRERANGKKVLNLFAFTCAFSVAAIAAGASNVVNLDMSKASLAKGRDNHRLNNHDLSQVTFLGHDLFKSWGKLKKAGPFDVVVIDPPSFQKGSFVATKDYQRVLRRLPELASTEADILLCLNDPAINSDYLLKLMAEYCPEATFIRRLPLPAGFPEQDAEKGLKAMVFSMSGNIAN